jgi:hypothetical protein
MDLGLYARVLWRFRIIVGVGVLLAIVLAVLTMYRPIFDGGAPTLQYRDSEVWRSDATLFVTQQGFPWGRISIAELGLGQDGQPTVPRYGDPDRFAELAVVYAELAQSDVVRRLLEKDGSVDGQILAEPLTNEDGDGLPLIGISALASRPSAAQRLAERQIAAFQSFIASEQRRNGIAEKDRVVVEPLAKPAQAQLETPRKKTRPLAILLATLMATIGVAFVLENLRPRIRMVPGGAMEPVLAEDGLGQKGARRSA